MKKTDLVKFLRRHGVEKIREDGDHEVWRIGECQAYVPKHRQISVGVCRNIRDDLAPELGEGWLK